MRERAQEEYRALRATIRERGTARVWVFIAGIVAWGAITVATATLAPTPLAVLLPSSSRATFEAVPFCTSASSASTATYNFYREGPGLGSNGDGVRPTGRALTTDPSFDPPSSWPQYATSTRRWSPNRARR